MKSSRSVLWFFTFAFGFLLTTASRGQTIYSFNDASLWNISGLSVSGANLNFTGGTTWPPSTAYSTFSAPVNRDWSVQVDVSMTAVLVSGSQTFLELVVGGGTNVALMSFVEFNAGGTFYGFGSGLIPGESLVLAPPTLTPTATLSLAYHYNDGSPSLTSYYNGIPLESNVSLQSWNMTTGSSFGFVLYAGAQPPPGAADPLTLSAGQAFFSNFEGTGLNAAPIPEPSVSPSLMGVLAFVVVLGGSRLAAHTRPPHLVEGDVEGH